MNAREVGTVTVMFTDLVNAKPIASFPGSTSGKRAVAKDCDETRYPANSPLRRPHTIASFPSWVMDDGSKPAATAGCAVV